MPDPQPVSLGAARRLDADCDRFESDWRAGKSPRIEDSVAAADAVDADALFRALLAVELELRFKNRERVTSAEYKARFPDRAPAVVEVFRAFVEKRKPGAGDTSVVQESIKEEAATLAPRPSPIVIQPGQSQIARFVLVELLGEGAFGQVFRARDPNLDRDVAIKTPRPGVINNEADRERFLREARALATVQHPNVCPVYEVGETDGKLYTVMAFVSGKTLAEAIKERKSPMPQKQAALIVRKLAQALDAAHAKGVIHRDLKPANIMFDRERKDVVVMDFGLARRAAAIESELTLSGFVLGTPAYMAPEQARGDIKTVGPCSDIYSLGVILYEMLAGRRPFSGPAGEVIGKVQHVVPDPPSKWRADVDPKLEAICNKAMAKDPAERYASMGQLATALSDWLKAAQGREGESPETGRSDAASAAPSQSEESVGLQQIFAALSDQRKQTVAAVESAVRKFRPPWWLWAVGAGFAGLVAVLGIIFFARTPTATILINVDVDLKDKELSFVLDGKPISAEELAKPIELKVGEHELTVFRAEKLEKWIKFSVTGGRNPKFKVEDVKVPDRPPPEDYDQNQQATVDHLKSIGARLAEAPIGNGKALTGIYFAFNNQVDDKLVERLKLFPTLESVNLHSCPNITDRAVEQLKALPRLNEVGFSNTAITDKALETLGSVHTLENMDISSNSRFTAEGIAHLKALSKLRRIAVRRSPITDSAVAHIGAIGSLQEVNLQETAITNQAAGHLAKLTNLDRLYLGNTKISDDSLTKLKDLKTLRVLDLQGTGVTDQCLAELSAIKTLQSLNVTGTRISPDGLRQLQQGLPNCTIEPKPETVVAPGASQSQGPPTSLDQLSAKTIPDAVLATIFGSRANTPPELVAVCDAGRPATEDFHGFDIGSDQRILAACKHPFGTVVFRDLVTGQVTGRIGTGTNRPLVYWLKLSPDGKTLYGLRLNQQLVAWSIDGRVIWRATAKADWSQPALSPDGQTLIAASPDGGLNVYDAPTGNLRANWPNLVGSGNCRLEFSPDGGTLGMVAQGSKLKLIEVKTGAVTKTIQLSPAPANPVFSRDGKRVFTSYHWKVPQDYMAETELATEKTQEYRLPPGGCRQPIINPAAPLMVSSGVTDNTLQFWNLDSGPNQTPLSIPAGHGIERYQFTKDGRYLVVGSDSGVLVFRIPIEEGVSAWLARRSRQPASTPEPSKEPATTASATDGFVPLFNGKDLTGWKTHPNQPGDWSVKDGMVTSTRAVSHLYTQRGDYKDFHLRMEIRTNGGNTGVVVRAPYGPTLGKNREWVAGYNAKFDQRRMGALLVDVEPEVHRIREVSVKAGEWVQFEVIAQGNRHIVKLNGELTADYTDGDARYPAGHIALEKHSNNVAVEFRKIEVKELPAAPTDDLSRLQGVWDVRAEEFWGAQTKEDEIKKMSKVLVFEGDQMSMHRNNNSGQRMKMSGKVQFDASTQPKTWDLVGTHYGGERTVFRGLYELNGDSLRMIYNAGEPGKNDPIRPTEFRTEKNKPTVIMWATRRTAQPATSAPSATSPDIRPGRDNVPTPASYLNRPPGLIWSTPAGTTWWWCACFSPRGDFVAAGENPRTPAAPGYREAEASKDGFTIRIWPIRDGQMGNDSFTIRHQGGMKRWQTAMTVSPDGRYLASGEGTGSINFFNMDATTPARLASFHRFEGVITGMAFSPDGRYFAAAARKVGSPVVVWDLAEPGKPKEAFTLSLKDQDEIASMIFSPDSQMLFFGGVIPDREGRLYSWNFRKDAQLKQLWSAPPAMGGRWVRSIDITPDGRELAIAYGDTGYLLDPNTGKVRLTLKGHAAGTSCQYVSFSRDGSRCLTAGYDKTIRLWSTKDGQQLWQNSAPSGLSEGAAISPDGRLAFTSSHISHEPSAGNSAQLWRLPEPLTEASERAAPNTKPELVALSELAAGQEKSGPWPSPDGLSLYWTEKPGGVMTLWRANRKSTTSPFEGAARIGSGYDLTLSSDLTEMIYVDKAADGKAKLHVRTKQKASDPQFGPARVINELKDHSFFAVSMSHDNLTLYGEEFVDARRIWQNVHFRRASRSQPWSQPEIMTISGMPADKPGVRFPFVTADGKYLIGNHPESPSGMVVLSSTDGGKTFGKPMVLEVPGGGVTGKFPRYIAATRELFFGDRDAKPDKKLYIIRNFDPAACTMPLK